MVVQFSRMTPAAEVVRLEDPASGLDGVIVIHSPVRGPGAGGCRFWPYPDLAAASTDAFRLAEGMSYKNAMAGLPFGGAKAGLRRPAGDFDREALFRAFGRAVADGAAPRPPAPPPPAARGGGRPPGKGGAAPPPLLDRACAG